MYPWAVSCKCKREALVRWWAESVIVSLCYQFFSLPFHEIFVLSHPGNEDSCYGKHTKEAALWTQLIPTITGLHQTIAIFKETMQTDKRGEGRKRVLQARSNFNHQGRALGWLTKWQEKPSSLWSGHVSLLSPWHNRRGWGGFLSVMWGEHLLHQASSTCVTVGNCVCGQSVYFYLVYTSKMTCRLRLFTTARMLNKRNMKSALILSWDF